MTRRQQWLALAAGGVATATLMGMLALIAPLADRYSSHLAAAGAQHTGLSQVTDTLSVGVPAVVALVAVVIGASWLRKAVRRG